jgi:glycosyltransferase involved in cell wall biosynthesis
MKLLRPWDINAIFPLNAEKEHVIDDFIRKKKYDYIAVRYINEAAECGLLKYADRLLLDLDDNPYKASMAAAQNARTLRNRIYTYIYACVLKWQVERTTQRVYRVFHSNPTEKPVEKSIYLHNVAMCDHPLPDITEKTPLQLLVIGTWHYAPNRDGLRYFLTNVYPKVCEALPHVNLRVVGRIQEDALREEWSKKENVMLVGYVQDLAKEYENVRMAIVPLYTGSGTSIKLLEAMCINRACVSTEQGARGMEGILKPDVDYLYAADDETFAKKIFETITDVDKCNELAHNALRTMNVHLSKDKFIEIIKNSIQ